MDSCIFFIAEKLWFSTVVQYSPQQVNTERPKPSMWRHVHDTLISADCMPWKASAQEAMWEGNFFLQCMTLFMHTRIATKGGWAVKTSTVYFPSLSKTSLKIQRVFPLFLCVFLWDITLVGCLHTKLGTAGKNKAALPFWTSAWYSHRRVKIV